MEGWKPTSEPDPGRLPRRAYLIWTVLAVAVALGYALFTSQAWEDYYISFRHSAHLVEGAGLTYQEGQRIQGFSSPITTLALAGAYSVAGTEGAALWIFRLLSIAAFAGGLCLLLAGLRRSGTATGGLPLALPGLVYLLDVKSVAFSVNGMETGLLLLFLAGALGALARLPAGAGWTLGAFWGGMMWTRPDSAVYIGSMALAVLLLQQHRRAMLAPLLRAVAACTAIYLPWFLFAWFYYGSPVPQSVTAKAAGAGILTGSGLAAAAGRLPQVLAYLYLPPYSEFSTWKLLAVCGGLTALAASLYWLRPAGRPWGRSASLVTLCGILYLALIPRAYPWYYPAVVLCSLPALAALLTDLSRARWATRGIRSATLLAATVLAGLGLGWAGIDCARTVRVMQRVAEDDNRREIGRWLARNAATGDRVYLECPGYIGYHSGLEMLDYPGLVAPQVVRARRLVGDDFAAVGRALAPEWMVLRTEEVEYLRAAAPGWLEADYRPARVFDVTARLRREAPDHPGILYDGAFHILRRVGGAAGQ